MFARLEAPTTFIYLTIMFICFGPQQTTNEISVWLVINLCSVLYWFLSMAFIYILFMGHDTTYDATDVLLIELVIGLINGAYQWSDFNRRIIVDLFSDFAHVVFSFELFQLHSSTCGIKFTYSRANCIWTDEHHSKRLYRMVPKPFKRNNMQFNTSYVSWNGL